MDKIDVVYTWCDGSAPEFIKARNNLCKKLGLPLKNDDDQQDMSKRYQQHDELLYSLRSLEKYAPWVNHIFIVTNNQCPLWLNDSPKVSIVNQNDIVPKEMQPVFNSVAIEQYITEIPNLSEHFLYLCDDMFFNRRVRPSDFFKNGKPVVWKTYCASFDFNSGAWERTLYNSYTLFLEKHHLYYPFFSTHHGIESFSKSLLKKILKEYPETFERNSTPFRDTDNVQRLLWTLEEVYRYDCPVRDEGLGVENKIIKGI